MNQNTAEGQLKEVKGSIKEALGKVVGSDSLEAEGATEKVVGRVQKETGKRQEAADDAMGKTAP